MELHADQAADHGEDQIEDQIEGQQHGLADAAELLLAAVAVGDERSVELAAALARSVLDGDIVQRARQLDELIRSRSPFALVRAVELAETFLLAKKRRGADSAPTASSRRSS